MTIELTDKNKRELIEKGGTFFEGATETEYQSLCQKADIFLANHMKNQFTNSVNTNAINNLSDEQVNQVANILGVK
jgi:hypothetical protein